MTYFPVQPRYSVYIDSLGDPLDDGYIYLGKANLDPTVYPAKASWDEAGLYPITFPVRTMNGYPLRDGIPAQMYLNFADNTEYSVLINDEDGVEVYSSTTGLIGYFPSGDGGDAATLNGLASDTAATVDTIAARDSSGDITANAFESTVATGTAPLTVASTTVVSNLNADLLDGQQGSYYAVAPIEGTFTPTIVGGTTAGTGTYTTQSGSYQRIGKWVSFRILLDWTAHTGTGDLIISGLPYTSANTRPTPCTVLPSNLTYTGDFIVGRVVQNTSTIQIMNCTTAAAASTVPIDTVGIVFISGIYEAA